MAQLGIQPAIIINELQSKNLVSNAGRVGVGDHFITIDPTGLVDTVQELGGILLSGSPPEAQIYLRDVVQIRRGFRDPPSDSCCSTVARL